MFVQKQGITNVQEVRPYQVNLRVKIWWLWTRHCAGKKWNSFWGGALIRWQSRSFWCEAWCSKFFHLQAHRAWNTTFGSQRGFEVIVLFPQFKNNAASTADAFPTENGIILFRWKIFQKFFGKRGSRRIWDTERATPTEHLHLFTVKAKEFQAEKSQFLAQMNTDSTNHTLLPKQLASRCPNILTGWQNFFKTNILKYAKMHSSHFFFRPNSHRTRNATRTQIEMFFLWSYLHAVWTLPLMTRVTRPVWIRPYFLTKHCLRKMKR